MKRLREGQRRAKGAPRGRRAASAAPTPAERVIEQADASLLDLIDNLLNKGVVLSGDVILGVADVDLVYLRLSVLLCAVDRVFPDARRGRGRSREE
ncbi:gas vesicle protein [bacterium]|nr:gas vesicle protein [bacterium]